MQPPIAKKVPNVHVQHFVQRIDHFHWLRDKTDPDVINYLERENTFTQTMMAHTAELQDTLRSEFRKQIPLYQQTAPYPSGDWERYARIGRDQDYWVHCRKRNDIEDVLLDENERARELEYYHLEDLVLSPDRRFLAWTEDCSGDEQFDLWIRDLQTNTVVKLVGQNIKWSLAWLDSDHLVYMLGDHANRPCIVKVHKIGTSFNEDRPIWTETDEHFHLSVERSRSGRAVICRAESKTSSEIRLLTYSTQIKLHTVQPRQDNYKYDVSLSMTQIFIRSNHTHREYALYLSTPQGLSDIFVPKDDEIRTIEDVDVMNNHLICWTRCNGLQELVVLDHDGDIQRTLRFPDPCYEIYPDVNPCPSTHLFRLRYSSLSMPDRVLQFDLNTGDYETIAIFDVLGVNPDVLECTRIWATSEDGTHVPISVVKHIDTPWSAPCMLHGYGAYGVSYMPGFHACWMPLINRGWIMAIAHVRGGGELGREWYENGKLQHKTNTFQDFVSCSEHLKDIIKVKSLIISGGSAGGLLVAAALNLQPELYDGCVAEVPFVDVTNTMMDADLPLTVIEYEEWGNPNQSTDFHTIQSYDPYSQYTGQLYPPLYVTAGLWDPRVGFWEPAKWVAKIRSLLPQSSHILLNTDLDSGHSGSSGREKTIQEDAQKYAFVLSCL